MSEASLMALLSSGAVFLLCVGHLQYRRSNLAVGIGVAAGVVFIGTILLGIYHS